MAEEISEWNCTYWQVSSRQPNQFTYSDMSEFGLDDTKE